MADTSIAFVKPTSGTNHNLQNHSNHFQNIWSSDISYSVSVDIDTVDVNTNYTISDIEDFVDVMISKDPIQQKLNAYDAVLLFVDKNFSLGNGAVEEIGGAFSDDGFAVIAGNADKGTTIHEIGHLYDAEHTHCGDKWGWLGEETVMCQDVDSCDGKTTGNNLSNHHYWSSNDCNVERMESHIKSNT